MACVACCCQKSAARSPIINKNAKKDPKNASRFPGYDGVTDQEFQFLLPPIVMQLYSNASQYYHYCKVTHNKPGILLATNREAIPHLARQSVIKNFGRLRSPRKSLEHGFYNLIQPSDGQLLFSATKTCLATGELGTHKEPVAFLHNDRYYFTLNSCFSWGVETVGGTKLEERADKYQSLWL